MKNIEVYIRHLESRDNLYSVAKLIYETDDHIYPALVGCEVIGPIIIAEIIKMNNTVFCYDNILVAEYNKEIIGVLVGLYKNCTWDRNMIMPICEKLNTPIPKQWSYTCDNYMSKLCKYKKSNIFYISNISVNSEYRNLGIGRKLLSHAIDSLEHIVEIHLHVLTNNKNAISLYSKFGMKISSEEQGFSLNLNEEVRCFYMIKKPNENYDSYHQK